MALFKINRGKNENLPVTKHDGYAYFTTNDGKFWIDFIDPDDLTDGVEGTLVRKALNAERADYVGYRLTLALDGDISDTYNGLTAKTFNITPENINALRNDTPYALAHTPGGAAISANKLNKDAGSSTLPVYFKNGLPFPVQGTLDINVKSANRVNQYLNVWLDGTQSFQYDGSIQRTLDITPENINALRNTTKYAGANTQGGAAISADKLNTNAGSTTIPVYFENGIPKVITGPVAQADKVTNRLKVLFNGTEQFQYDGSVNRNLNITPEAINALHINTNYALALIPGGAAVSANKLNTDAGNSTTPVFFKNGIPIPISSLSVNAISADKVNKYLAILFDGTFKFNYDGSIQRNLDITPEGINALRTTTKYALSSSVGGDALAANKLTVNGGASDKPIYFNNGVPTEVSGTQDINVKSADKVNHSVSLQINGTEQISYNGSSQNKIFNVTLANLGALSNTTFYALGDATGGNAVAANKLTVNGGSSTQPIYFNNGIPTIVSNSDEIDIISKQANSLKEALIYSINGTEQWRYNGSTQRTLNLTPEAISALPDTTKYALAEIVGGAAISANKLNKDAGSSTLPVYFKNGLPFPVQGTLKVNVVSANKVNNSLTIQRDGTFGISYDGSITRTIDITPENINALRNNTTYAGSSSVGGAAISANKINTDAGSNILPVYFSSGVPVAVSTSNEINILARQANKTTYWLKIQADGTDQITFDGSTQNKTINITPELINAVRCNGDTIPGPLTINGVFTANNDVYMDSATVGDLLVNGGTCFVGGVNAGKITASQFIGPLQGNATSADKVNSWLKIQVNGTDKVQYDGSGSNKTINLTADMLGLLGNTTPYALGDTVGGNAVKANALNVSAAIGSTTRPVYIQASGVPAAISNTDEIDLVAKSANAVKENFIFQVKGTEQWRYNGSTARTMNLSPALIDAFDIVEGSTVSGEAIFNNVVYLNDETYADSLTAENEIVTGTLRVVGDLNGFVINATTFNGALNGNATSADKVNHWLKIQFNDTDQVIYDGSTLNKTVNITPSAIGALSTSTNYASSATVGGAAISANKLNTDAGNSQTPVYFKNGIPYSLTGTLNNNVKSADKVNHWLKIQFNGTDQIQFDGSSSNKTVNITPNAIGALASTTNYASSSSVGGAAISANKLNTNAGSSTLPVYFTGGVPSAVSTTDTIDIVAKQANKTTYWLKIQADSTDAITFDGSTQNKTLNITPELINAVRRNGDTIPGPLTLNGVFTVNNDAYIDSATIGDLLVNGGTRFVGDVNAGKITASSFIGPLTGNATSADKVNYWLKIQFNGTDKVQYDGSGQNKTLNITPAAINAVDLGGDTMTGDLQVPHLKITGTDQISHIVFSRQTDNYIKLPLSTTKLYIGTGAAIGNAWYGFTSNGIHPARAVSDSNVQTLGTESLPWTAVYAGTFNGNATSANKVNNWLKIQFNGTDKVTYDGSSENKTVNITPTDIHAVDDRGDEMTGNLTFSNADIGISRPGRKGSWWQGRDKALLALTSVNSYAPLLSIKTTNGSWEMGHYNHNGYYDKLTFNYISDTEYSNQSSGLTPDIYFTSAGHIQAVSFDGNATSADKVNHWLKIQADGTDKVTFDGSSENKTIDITPELINAVRRNGDTIPGPLTLNGVMTVNNDAYIDSATIGDLLVNGGTRFVGDVNAGNITASQFTGPLAGNATSADKVNKWLKIQFNGTDQTQFDGSGDNKTVNVTPNAIAAAPQINGVYYGTCETAKGTKAKEVILVNGTGFQLVAGAMLVVKFTNASAAATMTLKVGTDAASAAAATGHTLYQYGTTKMGDSTGTNGWPAGAIVLFVFDGTAWTRAFWHNDQYTLPTVTNIDCGTTGTDPAKVITNGTWYTGTAGNLFEVTMRYANAYAGPLTFNGKPLYINGTASSASNCTLPAGKYIVFYDGTNYYFRTDGLVPHVNGIYKQRYGNSNTKGVANGRLYFLLSDYVAPSTAYSSDMYNKTIYYKAFYKIRGVSSNPSYNQNNMSGEFNTVIGVKINNSGASNLQQAVGYWSQVPTTFGSTSTIYISSDTNVVASRKHAQFYVTSSDTNDFEYEVELMSVEKLIVDDANSTVGTPEELHTTSYINGTYESCVFMNMTNTRTNCALLDSNYAGTISNSVYASLAFDASRLINYFTADNGTTNYYLTGRGSTTSGAYSYLYSNTKTYIKGSGLYSEGSLHMNDIYGTSGHTYGTTLPSSPITGQLFFQIDGASGSGSSGGSLSLAQKSSGTMYVLGYDGSDNTKAYYNTNVYVDCSNGILRGAAWNDYAEYRRDNHIEKRLQKPGNCVKENGDGTLSLTTKRLERGCEIISDTFGMAIGQNAREGYDTPIAVSGRVLAYPYESIEEFKAHIGYPVCSGPNGTVSIMTDEEEEKYSSRIIGTISEIPTYDKWGESQVDVDGRIWIRIK